ncbi:MAG: hypothetical protein ABH844_04100 [Candidatus Omnitrophota bacterium]
MKRTHLFRSLLVSATKVFIIFALFLNDEAGAIAPWMSSQIPMIKLEIRAAMERGRIIVARDDEDRALLKRYRADAVLLESWKYLVSEEVAADETRLIRIIIHEDIEALMQILRESDRYRYDAIKDLLLSNGQIKQYYYGLCHNGKEPEHLTADFLLNDMVAKALEIMFMVQNGFITLEDCNLDEVQVKEARFYWAIEKVIKANRYNYFREGLFISKEDARIRKKKITEALERGYNFYKAALPEASVIQASAPDIVDRIIEWHHSGKGLKDGDYVITRVNLGKRKCFKSRGKSARFSFILSGHEEDLEQTTVVFLAEEDINHGLVVNCHYLEDYKLARTTNPIVTFKYSTKKSGIEKVNLAALDIIYVNYDFPRYDSGKIISLQRPYKTTIHNNGTIWVGIPPGIETHFPCRGSEFFASGKMENIGKEVVVLVEDDKNHGQVINIYLSDEYVGEENSIPIKTYQYWKERKHKNSENTRAVLVRLNVLDIIRSKEGQELKIFNRPVKAAILKRDEKRYVCIISFMQGTPHEKVVTLSIPGVYMKRKDADSMAMICVEKDPNHGQIINVYSEKDFKEQPEARRTPIVTYKYFDKETAREIRGDKARLFRPIDLMCFDIRKYYKEKGQIEAKDRVGKRIVKKLSEDKFAIILHKILTKQRTIVLSLQDVAKDVFQSVNLPLMASIKIDKDKDYGAYIHISKDNTVLARYYFFRILEECKDADFERMAFLDYVLGNNNVYGNPVVPREFYYKCKIHKLGNIKMNYRGREYTLTRLGELNGYEKKLGHPIEELVFVPVADAKYGYRICVHNAAEYRKNIDRVPDVVLVRNGYYKKLIPIEKIDIFNARELMNKSFYYQAKSILTHFLKTAPNNVEAAKFLNTVNYMINFPGGIPFDKRIAFNLSSLGNAFIEEKDTTKEKNYFHALMGKTHEETEKLFVDILGYLDFDEHALPYQVYINCAVLAVLAEFPATLKTPDMALKVSKFLCYNGEGKEALFSAGRSFFESIPDEVKFIFSGKNAKTYESRGRKDSDEITAYMSDMSKYPRLTRLGEIALGVLARCGDEKARDILINCNWRLVYSLAKKRARYYEGMDLMDLISVGHEGLIKGSDKYLPYLGTRFSTGVYVWIQSSITRWARDNAHQIKIKDNMQEKMRIFNKKCNVAGIDVQKRMSMPEEELAECIDMKVREIEKIRCIIRMISDLTKSEKETPYENNNGDEKEKTVSSNDGGHDVLEMENMIDKTINEMKKRLEMDETALMVFEHRIAVSLKGDGNLKSYSGVAALCDNFSGRQVERKEKVVVIPELLKLMKEWNLESKDFFLKNITTGSPGAALRTIFKKFKFNRFSKKGLYQLRKKIKEDTYSRSTVDMEIGVLTALNVLIKPERGVYRLNPVFKGDTEAETESNIAAVYNIKFRVGKDKRTDVPMGCFSIPDDKMPLVKECVRMQIAHSWHKKAAEATDTKKTYTIKLWSGYAAPGQAVTLARIEKMYRNCPYRVEFVELKELVAFAKDKENEKESTVIILPYNELEPRQQRDLQDNKTRVIYTKFSNRDQLQADDIVQLEAIIGLGTAYLIDNETAFMNLCSILMDNDKDTDIVINLKSLKENPLAYIVCIKIEKINLEDLPRLNDRLNAMVKSL